MLRAQRRILADMARVLGRIRLSHVTDETTSPERQRKAIETWAAAFGHVIVGWAVDLDFSRSIKPFDAPDLGPWLNDPIKADEWDILVAWRLDRLGAGLKLAPLYSWCLENDKDIVCTTQPFNLRTTEGRIIATVLAEIAQGEWEATQERRIDAMAYLRSVGRWGGGMAAYWQRGARSGAGWTLKLDPESAEVTRRIIREFLDGRPVSATCEDLTAEGIPTPLDHHREQEMKKAEAEDIEYRGKAPEGRPWKSPTIWKMLASPALLGWGEHDGRVVRGEDGEPIVFGEPLIELDEFNRIQAEIERRQAGKAKRERNSGPLLGVATCLTCEGPLHHTTQRRPGADGEKVYRYYRCPKKCSQQVAAEVLEEATEAAFLAELGEERRRERVYVPAVDHTAELEAAERAVDELAALMESATSERARERLRRQLTALDARIAELEKMPPRPSAIEHRETDRTYGDIWRAADAEGRRELLISSGITIAVRLTGRTRTQGGYLETALQVPDDVRTRDLVV